MNSKESVRLALPGALAPECLRDVWGVEVHPRESMALTFWDTFEWGLWFGGHVLYSCGEFYRLCSRTDRWMGSIVCEEPAAGGRRFWGDFKTEQMRELLQGMLGLRGIAPVAEGTVCRRKWDLRNEMGKIVCRLEFAEVCAGKRGERKLLHSCLVMPLLGYEADTARVVECLVQGGASSSADGPLEVLLRAEGREPRPYTLRPAVGQEIDTVAREAVARIVTPMLEIAKNNVPGILDDIDTEFLHDYRICLRKVRSALSLVKGVYPPEETRRMRTILGDLARRTNRLRDLDVYLLAKEEYLRLLPPALRQALDQMFADFAKERKKELRRTTAALQAPSSRQLFQGIEEFFSPRTRHGPAPAADLPVGPLVFLRIYKTYRNIRRIAALIAVDTPDEVVHELRIECKKLRYLLEFFKELIPEKDCAALVKSLRRLQDRLGEFNDASVQQKSLMDYWQQKGAGTDFAMALGGLVSILYERQQRTRSYIIEALREFCGDDTVTIFKHTFKVTASLPAAAAKGLPQP